MMRLCDCSAFRTCAEGGLFIAFVWHSAYSQRHVLHVQLQDGCLAVGLFVRIPVRGYLLGLRLVRWGSMSLHGLCGGMCHLRYSMGGSRCAPPQRLCIPGAKLFRVGPIALLTPPPIPREMMPPTERYRFCVSGEHFSELATSTSQWGRTHVGGVTPDKMAI